MGSCRQCGPASFERGEEIVESDDPRWIAAERETLRAIDVMDDRACDLLDIKPTTIAGLLGLLA